jgi:hypothetical protein
MLLTVAAIVNPPLSFVLEKHRKPMTSTCWIRAATAIEARRTPCPVPDVYRNAPRLFAVQFFLPVDAACHNFVMFRCWVRVDRRAG